MLENKLGKEHGAEYMAWYVSARKVLLEDVLDKIHRAEPNLTDHGPDHVRHVLENVFKLLEGELDYFKPIELYILGLCVLFHDVGNLEGRQGHNRRIAQFYDHVRNGLEFAPEKALIVRISGAHTGKARNGTGNTLADVPPLLHLSGEPVRSREIAAIVRFADELAEGPKRTSAYLRNRRKFPPDSILHHDYASATHIAIDRGNSRIAITYHFELKTVCGLDDELSRLKGFLQYVCARLAKVDIERRYARYHCPRPLLPFQKISVCLDLQIDGEFVDQPLEATISDEVNLDSSPKVIWVSDPLWKPESVAEWVRQEVLKRSEDAEY